MTRTIEIQGHRGARGLFPENTLEGFLASAAIGVTSFELDAGMTADGVVVVSHDLALNPDITRDDRGRWLTGPTPLINSLTHDELRQWDVGRIRPGSRYSALFPDQRPHEGARIPTLATVLTALPTARFIIEIKTDPRHPDQTAEPAALADAVLAVVDRADATRRIMIESFDWRGPRHVRRIRPAIRLAWLTRRDTALDRALWWDLPGSATNASIPAIVAAEGGEVWAPEQGELTEADIIDAHRHGLLVMPWTVNHPTQMARLAEWGVDGLISDRPDLAQAVVSRSSYGG
jgi:glycerophosphoryl diester phosphodiesterase